MANTEPLKSTYLWRPSDVAWQNIEAKAKRDRRPINQILNDIVLDYFTPKLFDNVLQVGHSSPVIKKVAKRNSTKKAAKTKVKNKD